MAALSIAAVAAPTGAAAPAAPAFTSSFQKPPSASLKALRATVGKPFKEGYVFIDGRYLPPPYKVERWGTVLRINGVQVTSEIVPWDEFVKTQTGVTATKSESPLSDDIGAAEPEPEPEPEPEEEIDDDDSSLDDLFDDDPAPKKKKPAKRKTYKPKPKKPTVTVTYSFDGEFTPNEKTKAYVDKINKERTRVDKGLRSGGYFCFSSKYSTVTGDAGAAKHIMEKLPGLMKNYSDLESFSAAVNAAGFSYLPPALVNDLFKNRIVYPQLMKRIKDAEEERKWMSIGF